MTKVNKCEFSSNNNFLANVQDIEFWKTLCPNLSITQMASLHEDSYHYLDQDQWLLCQESLKLDGYFKYNNFLSDQVVEPLHHCIEQLVKHDIPPVFAFVYDEFWKVLCQLQPLARAVFGNEYIVLPDFYAWYVTYENDGGFEPHRDHVVDHFINDDGLPNYITFWIPLVDVTTLQSCIYIMPGSHDNHYPDNLYDINIDKAEKIRALPASAGSVLSWNVGLMHWGSVSSPLAPPRESIAFCLQSAKHPLLSEPSLNLNESFPFLFRLGLIGRQLLEYTRNRDSKLLQFAQELNRHLDLNWKEKT